MVQIFISYRRVDSAAISRRIYDSLVAVVGKKRVFRDVDTLMKGHDFRAEIETYLIQSDVALIIIGTEWLKIRDAETGERRLDNVEDFVRLEVDMALRHCDLVIPVLVNGARMPSETELPVRLASLAFNNAVMIRTDHYEDDFQILLDSIGIRRRVPRTTLLGGAIFALVVLASLFLAFLPQAGAAATMPGAEVIQLQTEPTIPIIPPTATATIQPTASPTPTYTATSPPPTSTPTPQQTGQIAFASDRDGDFEIYVMDVETGEIVQLTNTSRRDWFPSWSPDGSRIAYVSEPEGGGNRQIYVMNADGSNQQNLSLVERSGDVIDFAPCWSPDGSRILFYSLLGSNWELLTMNPDGTNVMRLTQTNLDEKFPAWSPNGLQIAFEGTQNDHQDIFIMNADGSGEPVNLTGYPSLDTSPDWSPSGVQIAFEALLGEYEEIFVMNVDGSRLVNLTNHPNRDTAPDWSSDGSQIAFASDRDGNLEIYVMDANGGNVRRITTNAAQDRDPDWRPTP